MRLKLVRSYKGTQYTIGKLYVNNKYFCDTLEDVDRGLISTMGANEIQEKKIAGKTAIPTGSYEITLNVQSPKFSDFTKYPAYKFCDGYLPRLKDVPGFDGILIHIGNYDTDTDGCILIGYNTAKGMVSQSTDTFKRLYDLLVSSDGEIYIEIV